MKRNHFAKRIVRNKHLPEILSILAIVVTIIQAFFYAHHMDVTMDEGTYLMKGLLYIKGIYIPFQEYGPWTNKMPLAFIIPGIPQAIFEPGLRTGRYFSIFLIFLTQIALWLVSKRLAGRWWATMTLWLYAINPAGIAFHTLAISQVITSFLLAWALFFILGSNRRLWQIILGIILSTAILFTRQNLVILLLLILLYIFWQHGKKAGLLSVILSGLLIAIVHLIYWPRIVSVIWMRWIPDFIQPLFGDIKITTGGATRQGQPTPSFLSKVSVFWEGLRYCFPNIVGSITACLFWPQKKKWQNQTKFRVALFLGVAALIQFFMHYFAAVETSINLYGFSGYLAFFTPLFLLLPTIVLSNATYKMGKLKQVIACMFILLTTAGLAFSAYDVIANDLMNITVPRMRNMHIQPGTTELWRLLANKFDLQYEVLQRMLPAIAGAIFGLLLILLTILIYSILKRKGMTTSIGNIAIGIFIAVGLILTPTIILGGGKLLENCSGDVILQHEKVGKELADVIPGGSLVYWQNDVSPLPLLYLRNIRIFPAQLNHWYSYWRGGNPDLLEKNGYWNAELAYRWKQEADFILIADKYNEGWQAPLVEKGIYFDELAPTPATVPCRTRSIIHIYKRIW
jgi:hypothetical protein